MVQTLDFLQLLQVKALGVKVVVAVVAVIQNLDQVVICHVLVRLEVQVVAALNVMVLVVVAQVDKVMVVEQVVLDLERGMVVAVVAQVLVERWV
jgi:hypothetical protein